MKKLLLYSLMLFILVASVLGNPNWFNYGNMGYSPSINEGFIAFASPFPSFHNISVSETCVISGAYDFHAVSDDLDLDGVNEIVLVDGNRVDIYDSSCTFEDTYTITGSSNTDPIIYNSDGNSLGEIIIADSNTIYLREFDSDTEGYEIVKSITHSCGAVYSMACGVDNNIDYCALFTNGKICHFDIDSGINVFNVTVNTGINLLNDRGSGVVRFTSSTPLRGITPVFATNRWVGYAYNINGSLGPLQCETPTISPGAPSYRTGNAISGSLGSSKNANIIAVSGRNDLNGLAVLKVCDINGAEKLLVTGIRNVSNSMVGDFDGDGLNELCSVNDRNFTCYDSLFNEEFRLIGFDHDIISSVIADFDDSNDFLELVTVKGIYDISSGTPILILNNTEFTEDQGFLTVVQKDNTLTNVVIDVESTKTIIFGFGGGLDVVCGDGVCNGGETVFTCFEDCFDIVNVTAPDEDLLPDGELCLNSSLCQSGKCMYGSCVAKSTGEDCSFNFECRSDECVNGRCRKPSLMDNIQASKDETFGDDVNTNNLISIATMVLVGGGIMASGNIFAVIGAIILVFAMGGFFIMIGWLSFWIFMLMIIVAIIGGTVVILLKAGGNN